MKKISRAKPPKNPPRKPVTNIGISFTETKKKNIDKYLEYSTRQRKFLKTVEIEPKLSRISLEYTAKY